MHKWQPFLWFTTFAIGFSLLRSQKELSGSEHIADLQLFATIDSGIGGVVALQQRRSLSVLFVESFDPLFLHRCRTFGHCLHISVKFGQLYNKCTVSLLCFCLRS